MKSDFEKLFSYLILCILIILMLPPLVLYPVITQFFQALLSLLRLILYWISFSSQYFVTIGSLHLLFVFRLPVIAFRDEA